jgi:hypothetical protein|tara:strand:+ start:8773 stop:8874 length:102 start_codon:yes stop_codon:yes gene_type:complete
VLPLLTSSIEYDHPALDPAALMAADCGAAESDM